MPPQQQQLTDPDVWMQGQQQAAPEDPDVWMQKQAKTAPFNPMSGLTKAEHIGPGPSAIQETGQNILNTVADPKMAVPALATAAAAPFTAGMSIPASASVMAGVNAAGTGIAHGINSLFGIPQPPLKGELTWSAAGGAAPEMLGVLGRGPQFFTRSPMGEQSLKLLGDKAGLHEVAQHPVIDFMHNIASAGMGGRGRMEAAQADRATEELQSLIGKSEEFAPGGSTNAKLLPDVAQQGADIRSSITGLAGNFYNGVVAPAYHEFGPGEQYGRIPVSRVDSKGNPYVSTVNDILKERSEVGKAMSATTDRMERSSLSAQYDSLTKEIENHLPQSGQFAWQKAKSAHAVYSKVWENLTVEQILQSPTKENEVLSLLYNPQGGGALGGKPLQTSDKTIVKGGTFQSNPPTSTGLVPQGTAIPPAPAAQTVRSGRSFQLSKSNAELLKEAKTAMGNDEWNHTAVAAIQHIVESAVGNDGILDGAKLKNLFEAMDPDVKDVLFGTSGKTDELGNLINTVAYAERKPKSAAGTLFINIRQGAAIIGAASAAAGVAGELLGDKSGASGTGMITGGVLMLSPNIMARILSSPVARDWLTKSANAISPTVKEKMVNMAIKTSAQYLGRGAFKAADQREQSKRQSVSVDPNNLFLQPPPGQIAEPPK